MNGRMLKGMIAMRGKKIGEVAEAIGMSRTQFSAKANAWRGSTFTVEQAAKLCKELELSTEEAYAIFFA